MIEPHMTSRKLLTVAATTCLMVLAGVLDSADGAEPPKPQPNGLGVQHQGHLNLPTAAPLASVWHTMLDRVGVNVPGQFQDSKGPLKQLIRA